MNVLSLFDGMSCGRIALERAGIPISNYYASEIDKHAIKVSKRNWRDVKHIGDVRSVLSSDYQNVDLLIAGSPCQGFSFAGKQLAFEDERSKLYFEFLRLYREINPRYFLLENVKMKQIFQDVISNDLEVSPIIINSSVVSAQSRPRLYWTNIPQCGNPIDKNILAKDIIDYTNTSVNSDGWQEWWKTNSEYQIRKRYSTIMNDCDKAVCQTARQVVSWNGNLVRNVDGSLRFLSVLEAERLQTVPENYTACVSKTQAYKMLGNGWTVDVVAHLLHSLRPGC
jgi:DNA-cytosine methyltransferase